MHECPAVCTAFVSECAVKDSSDDDLDNDLGVADSAVDVTGY